MDKKKKQISISRKTEILVLLFVLFLAVLYSFLPTDTYAKYTGSVAGTDTAVVATPILKVSPVSTDIAFASDLTGTYKFSVSNADSNVVSKTKMSYTIVVTVPAGSFITPGALYSATNNSYTTMTEWLSEGVYADGVYTYHTSAMTLSLNSQTKYFVLELVASTVGSLEMEVSVVAEQLDT